MKYNVHLYAVVRIKVIDIEAESHIEAIEKAEPFAWDFAHEHLTGDVRRVDHIDDFEFAEEMKYALVDEQGDEDYEKSCFYEPFFTGEGGWRTLRD